MGYRHAIYPAAIARVQKNLDKALALAALNSHELSKEEIAQVWMDANAEVYNQFLNSKNSYLESSCTAANVYNNNWQAVNTPPKIIKLYKHPFNYKKFVNATDPNTEYYRFILGPKYNFDK